MIEQSLLLKLSSPMSSDHTTSRLRQEYQAYQKLYEIQSSLTQQYLISQAVLAAKAIVDGDPQLKISLPDRIICVPSLDCSGTVERIPEEYRKQKIGSPADKLTHTELCAALSKRLSVLEQSRNTATSISSGLVRYAIALQLVYRMLPAGNPVIYAPPEGEDIPNQPLKQVSLVDPLREVKVDGTEKVAQDLADSRLEAPYVQSAKYFFLPQWVAFDTQGQLLTGSINEAEAHITSMQKYLAILNNAITIAPYMITDEAWQERHYGILGQLVNQGRLLARYQTEEIIRKIQSRAAGHKLDRGLRISLPYFDDKKLALQNYDFVVIPYGRIMFHSAFTVLAAREQQLKIAQDGRLSFATRKHLIKELHSLELAFKHQV
jgi:hypothetical protein